MLEAYEIGISLALQDGVSDGIALIRRDLAALDRAIAATSQSLTRLQVQAGTPSPVHVPSATQPKPMVQAASSPAVPEQQALPATPKDPVHPPMSNQPRPDAPVLDIRSPISGRPTSAMEPSIQNPPQRPQPAISVVSTSSLRSSPSATTPQQLSTEAPPASSQLQANPVAPQGPAKLAPPSAPAGPSVPAAVQIVSKVAADPPTASRQPPVAAAMPLLATRPPDVAVPLLAAPPPRAARALLVTPGSPAAPARLPPAVPHLQQPSPVPPPRHTGHSQHVASHHAQAPSRRDSPVEPAPRPRADSPVHTGHHAAVPQAQPSTSARAAAPAGQSVLAPTSAPQPTRTSSFAPPPTPSEQTITLQGDIILDGARLGRWMTSSLARQAARPPAGPTGPDPRQTPLWSGQAQGF